jgi:hypothetical protein
MCMQCVGTVGTAFQAATLIGGPIALKYYQRVRALFGLPDNSAAAVAARARALEAEAACCDGGCSRSPTPGIARRGRARAPAGAVSRGGGPSTTRRTRDPCRAGRPRVDHMRRVPARGPPRSCGTTG